MIHESMTVHEALATLKVLDKRIDKEVSNAEFCSTVRHSATKVGSKTIEAYKGEAKESFDCIQSLLARRAAIRAALSISNAKTTIEVCGRQYSIAEAIELKSKGLYNYDLLLDRMETQLARANSQVENNNGDKLTEKADKHVESVYGSKEKVSSTEAIELRKLYIEANTLEIVQGFDLKKEIGKLSQWLEEFHATVDSKISVSNALTVIEYDY